MRIRISFMIALLSASAAGHPWLGSSASTPAPGACPRIEVTSPDERIFVGTPINFTVSLSGADPAISYSFGWDVSAGTITGGQGTTSITVDSTGLGNQIVKATVEVKGVAKSCPKSESYSVPVLEGIACIRPLDSYGDISFEDEQARLDNFAIELQNNLAAQGYIIAYGGRRGREGEGLRRAGRARDYISERRGIDASRILTVDGGYREELTVDLWLVPQGAAPPQASPTVDPSEVQIIDGMANGRKRVRNWTPRPTAACTRPAPARLSSARLGRSGVVHGRVMPGVRFLSFE